MAGRRKSEETRQAIVRCAAEVFSEREFHEVLTDDIADRLGIGKGTMYRYFRSKEDLYLAATARGFDELRLAISEVLDRPAPLATSIEDLVRTVVFHFWKRRDFFLLLYRLEAKMSPQDQVVWQTQRNEIVRKARRILERAAATGAIHRLNPRLAVEALFGMIRGACLYRAESDRPEEVVRTVTEIFLRGLGCEVPPPRSRRPLRIVRGGNTP